MPLTTPPRLKGCCELCCASWLREFTPVSIKMAKQQDLPLNTSEDSGVCGRLLCCLGYENEFYTEARKQMPRINSTMETPQGLGKVKQVHVLANSVTVLVEGPGDTRIMVDVSVPEPIFASAPVERGNPRLASDEEVTASPMEDAEDLESARENPAQAKAQVRTPVKPAMSAQSHRSRGRRRQQPGGS